ncbi:hypothetical protein [Azospirillum sp. ST 5-10]|uniref:hypothetical protein n=1 Tax=unclassified Azospirillum TaxID=2630922 RepID=UPI003F49CDFD
MSSVVHLPRRGATTRPAIRLDLHREPTSRMADWQADVIWECRRHAELCPAVFGYLKRTDLLHRCTFLASDTPDGPLLFRYIGAPTIAVLGRGWARQQLGRPHVDNPHADFPAHLGTEYATAMEDGPVFNQIAMHGLGADPWLYSHALCGWRARDGRRAVLSAIALH